LFCSDDCRSWPREEKINNHGCWGKHAHIPDNDYWGICLFHVVWTIIFFCNYSYVVHTKRYKCTRICRFPVVGNIFRFETCMNSLVKIPPYSKLKFQGKFVFTQNWCNITLYTIISPKEFKSWVTRISLVLLSEKTELSAVKYFAICS
jgi:hypothetical protein